MSPWRWALAIAVVVAVIGGVGFRFGVMTQRRDDLAARLRLAVEIDTATVRHAREVADLNASVSRFSTLAAIAVRRAEEAEAGRQSVREAVRSAQEALTASQTTVDSLTAYPPLVEALTRQVEVVDSARVAYRDALAASQERSGLLLRRIAADSTLIQRQAVIIANIIPPPPPSKSRWACVAGATIAMGVRAGAGLGIACGRTL